MKYTHPFLALVSLAALAAGCSVLNSFDEVQQEALGGSGGTAGSAASGGTAGSAGTAGSSMGGTGNAGTGGTAGTGGSEPLPPGLIVVAGEGNLAAGGRGAVISAISPYTGEEYSRTEFGPMITTRVAHDPGADIWYVFEQKGTVTDYFDLHAWRFSRDTGEWEELGTASVPAPKGVIAVLNKRVYYQSVFRDGASAPTEGFSLVNADDPTDMRLILPIQDNPAIGGVAFAMTARPNSAGGQAGGNLNIYTKSATCPATGPTGEEMCDVTVRLGSISPTSTRAQLGGTARVLGQVQRNGGSAAAVRAGDEDAIAFPDPLWVDDATTAWTGVVERIQPTLHSSVGQVSFTVDGPTIRDAAWDPCNRLVFATELSKDPAIFAVPTTAGGTTFRQGISTAPVAVVRFDQYTRTVFQPRDEQANFSFRAFEVKGTNTAPDFEERLANSPLPWDPPTDLRPLHVVVAEPPSQVCP